MGIMAPHLRRSITRARVFVATLLLFSTCEMARAAEPAREEAPSPVPRYTLEVASDEPGAITYADLAARLRTELAGDVEPPSAATSAARVAIVVVYRASDRLLTVRATHAGGRVVERSVTTTGDAAAVRDEAVLLAGNVARDEARELLDTLAARRPRNEVALPPAAPEPPAAATTPRESAPEEPADGRAVATVALAYPLATNTGHPDVRTPFDLSLFYGRVGTVTGLQLGLGGIVHASRRVEGAQVAAIGAAAEGPVSGAQVGGIANLALASVRGAQLGGALNVARGGLRGAQLAGGANLASGPLVGVQISGGLNAAAAAHGAQVAITNIAAHVEGAQVGLINVAQDVRGAQIGLINVAREVDGAAIGLASITRDGVHPLAWSSNLAFANAGIKFATKYLYTVSAVGSGTDRTRLGENLLVTLAVGLHLALPRGFDAELETAWSAVLVNKDAGASASSDDAVHQRALLGYSFASHLRLFAGGGARLRLDQLPDAAADAARPEFIGGIQF
jgi:hypothetical protein